MNSKIYICMQEQVCRLALVDKTRLPTGPLNKDPHVDMHYTSYIYIYILCICFLAQYLQSARLL